MGVAWERDSRSADDGATVEDVVGGLVCFVCMLLALGSVVLLGAVLMGR